MTLLHTTVCSVYYKHQYLGLWDDQVGSQLARPLDSTVFCSIDLQQQQFGTGPKYSHKGMNYYGGADLGGYAQHKMESPPSRASTMATSIGSRGSTTSMNSSLGGMSPTPSRGPSRGTTPGTPGTPGTSSTPGTPGTLGMSNRSMLGTPPTGHLSLVSIQSDAGAM